MEQLNLKGGVFEWQKDSVVLGTYESSAFILSLRDPDEFSSIHSFGYHRIPHVGERYSNSYMYMHVHPYMHTHVYMPVLLVMIMRMNVCVHFFTHIEI